MYDFLDSKKILCDGQFGFRSKNSTSHAVHHHLSFVDKALEHNLVPLTVFLDFGKLFETVEFITLLSRLTGLRLGRTCVNLFSSYLHGRIIKVALSEAESSVSSVEWLKAPCWDLYLFYVNSLASHVGEEALTSFTDATLIKVIACCLVEVVHKADLALVRLRSFTVGSSLAVNASKKNYIIFSRRGRLLTFFWTFTH